MFKEGLGDYALEECGEHDIERMDVLIVSAGNAIILLLKIIVSLDFDVLPVKVPVETATQLMRIIGRAFPENLRPHQGHFPTFWHQKITSAGIVGQIRFVSG